MLAALAMGSMANAQSFKKLPRAVQKELKNLEFVKGDSLKEFIPYKGHPSTIKPAVRAVVNDFICQIGRLPMTIGALFIKPWLRSTAKKEPSAFCPILRFGQSRFHTATTNP